MPESPEPPPIHAQPVEQPGQSLAQHQYQEIADRIGFVPNTRGSDNLIQGLAVLGGLVLGAIVGYLLKWGDAKVPLLGAGLGAIAGLLLATFASGLYLAIRNLSRRRP